MMNFGEKRKSGCYKGKSPINQRKEEPKFILKSHYNNQQSN